MRLIAIAAAVLTLAGCETMRTVAPHTTAGFEAGGVLGALDGASGAVLARCRTLDGQVLRVAMDDLALGTGNEDAVGDIRVRRQQACAVIGAVQVIADERAASAGGVMGPDAGIGQGYGAGQASAVLPES
jgi:hypothetical protein